MKKIAILALVVAILLLAFTGCAAPLDESKSDAVKTAYTQTGELLSDVVGAVGEDWAIIGLTRSGRLSEETAKAYQQAAAEYVSDVGSAKLHRAKCTENARMILALTAVGGDVTDVGGYNLLEGLAEMDYVTKQGNTGPAWALIALDCSGYEIPTASDPEKQVTRERLLEHILSVQCDDGGWGLSAEPSDVDVTAMVLQALSAYRKEEKVAAAIERALAYLSQTQSEDGGYVSYGAATSESCAQVVVALTALGIHPDTDSRFVKNGNSIVDALCRFAVNGGGFCHILSMPERNGVATEQGYYALTAYYRFLEGKSSLYDMRG